ncbi:MAG: hypothetical protein H6809_00325 [Phycisphaeraceae bacterium]|nr:hypothetical protein [Phycisphaeraceae bacterium]
MPGCSTSPEAPETPAIVEPERVELPSYAEVAGAQNRRVADLDRVWAAASALVTYQDQDGQVRTEQAEGYLQIIQADRVALSLGKQIASEVYFYLGANATHYWWFDRLEAGRKIAYVGTHEMASPERAASLGAPVHPLDLLDLIGITALPGAVEVEGAGEPADRAAASREGEASEGEGGERVNVALAPPPGARVAWSPDGRHVLVDVPARFGTRRMWFDPATMLPRRVELLDSRGRVSVASVLERDVLVEVRGDSRRRPLMAENIDVTIPGTPIRIRLLLDRIENRQERQSAVPFDLERLLRAYPVDRVEDVDLWEFEEVEDGAAGGGEATPGGVRVPDRRLRVTPGARPGT